MRLLRGTVELTVLRHRPKYNHHQGQREAND